MSSRPNNTRISAILLLVFLFGILLILAAGYTLSVPKQANFQSEEPPPNPNEPANAPNCEPWTQVNANGFGLPSEFDTFNRPTVVTTKMPFQGEEGFEVLVFNDQLYLGMEADNLLGARLWRSRPGVKRPTNQLDWEEVAADQDGKPFGVSDTAQADHIDSLAEFRGWIFASLANRSGAPKGTLVFRSPSGAPKTWENALQAIGPGFGKPQNENFKDMQVFDGYLCGGTWNETDGAEVWCTPDGTGWQQKNSSGFGDPQNIIIWSGHVFNDQLYFGVEQLAEDGETRQGRLYRTPALEGAPAWEEVYRTPLGVSWGNILGDLNGYLYISLSSPDGLLVYRSASGDANTWENVNQPGFDNTPSNWGVVADGAAIYRQALYLGVINGQNNFTLWRTDGKSTDASGRLLIWEQIPTNEIIDPFNIYVQLVSFNDFLYAWTSNPVNGQQVWRTQCPGLSQE